MTEEKDGADNKQGNTGKISMHKNAQLDPELEASIICQVEFYFGDINLPRDQFLLRKLKLDNGWVPLSLLTRFNRLASLTKDTDVIANALLNSKSGLLELSHDNKKVRRSPELPAPEMNESRRKELTNRTIYAEGFPTDVSLDDLLKFFTQFEEVENVVMGNYQDRYTKRKLLNGSVFAIFKTKEQAEKFMELKSLKYGDSELRILWQQGYNDEKQEEYKSRCPF